MGTVYTPMVGRVKSTIGCLRKNRYALNLGAMGDRPHYGHIGARLRAVREGFSDLSQKAWAEKNGFNYTQYNNWENGSRRISVDAAEKLCDRYGLDLDYIYRGRVSGLAEKASKIL